VKNYKKDMVYIYIIMRYIKLQLAGGSIEVCPAGHGAARRCEDRGNIEGRPLSALPLEKTGTNQLT
jgi:hypothetical protein